MRLFRLQQTSRQFNILTLFVVLLIQEPARPRSSFQGVGRTLGGGSSTDDSPAPAPVTQEPNSAPRSISFVVDDTQPFTSIQLRLADGTRMVARFNLHHTVGDIRSFIDASRPGAARPYQLQTGFPPKQLTDSTQTVEQAGLKNSVIMQKMQCSHLSWTRGTECLSKTQTQYC